jgi:hypothetical protein
VRGGSWRAADELDLPEEVRRVHVARADHADHLLGLDCLRVAAVARRRLDRAGIVVGLDPLCARRSLVEEEGGSNLKLRLVTRGENPTGDDGDRHAGSESCAIVRKHTGDRDREA